MANRSRGRLGVRAEAAGGGRLAGSAVESGVKPGQPSDSKPHGDERAGWPGWARRAVTVVLALHMGAVVAGAVGVPPSSELERGIADLFSPYFDLMDLGYSYRFYAEPPPTPVVTATIEYEDGRPDATVRLPGREVVGPRMRHQRQLALAHALHTDIQETRRRGKDAGPSRLARSYARHLCRTRPGCRSVTLRLEQHLIPDPEQVRQALAAPGAPAFDLFSERLFTTPEWIGDFPCDDF